jgi:hypothetical protein
MVTWRSDPTVDLNYSEDFSIRSESLPNISPPSPVFTHPPPQLSPISQSVPAVGPHLLEENLALPSMQSIYDSPTSGRPIMAFLSNASLAAEVIGSLASSTAISPQQSLELSAQSRALVQALDSWVQRIGSSGPSPQDFYAARILKASVVIFSSRFLYRVLTRGEDSDLRALEAFLVHHADQDPATLAQHWDEVQTRVEELRGRLFRKRYYWVRYVLQNFTPIRLSDTHFY